MPIRSRRPPIGRRRALVAALAAAALVAAAPARGAAQEDLAGRLVERNSRIERLRVLVRSEARFGDAPPDVRFHETFVDVRRDRVRTTVRAHGSAAPHLVSVYRDGVLRARQLQFDAVAEQERPLELGRALAATAAPELVAAAFTGRPPSFAASAYGQARRVGTGDDVAGAGCTRFAIPGNAPLELWIGDADGFPRRLRGTLGALELEETVLELDLAAELDPAQFELVVPDGKARLDLAQAQREWRAREWDEPAGWPQPGDDSPDFAGVDLEGRVRLLSETGELDAVLAFWNPELPDSARAAAALEEAWRGRTDAHLLFWHVAAGRRPDPVRALAAELNLRETLVVAGEHEKNAFLQFSIWRCPVFVKLNDMQVTAVTADLAEAKRWLR